MEIGRYIFFVIASAFDKVWHDGLVYKLSAVPLYLCNIIKSFLSGGLFRVLVNEAYSEYCPIECGVPQGSVLSPTLFSILINDIPYLSSPKRVYAPILRMTLPTS